MQRLFTTLLILATTVSCSDAPPAQQAATEKSVDPTKASETPVADANEVVQPPAVPAAEETSHIDVGDAAPNFRLKDQTGAERSLDDLLADGNVALVFYRSADW